MNFRKLTLLLSCLFFGLANAAPAQADTYPNRPITLVLGYPPGGSADMIARLVADELTRQLGQTVVISNKAGAAGIIAADFVAKAAPDGYTLLSASSTEMAVNYSAYKQLPYDSKKDFTAIIQYCVQPSVLLVAPKADTIPTSSVPDLIAYAKAHPDTVSFGSAGHGSTQHMAAQLFMALSDTKLLHVPYKGDAYGITDLIGGRIDLQFSALPSAIGYVRNGRLKALALTGTERSPLLPEVPTLSEIPGLKDYEFTAWHGLTAPAGTPPEIVERLNQALQGALQGKLGDELVKLGLTVTGGTPEQFQERFDASIEKYGQIIKASGMTLL